MAWNGLELITPVPPIRDTNMYDYVTNDALRVLLCQQRLTMSWQLIYHYNKYTMDRRWLAIRHFFIHHFRPSLHISSFSYFALGTQANLGKERKRN